MESSVVQGMGLLKFEKILVSDMVMSKEMI
jgi:hypothetical protein